MWVEWARDINSFLSALGTYRRDPRKTGFPWTISSLRNWKKGCKASSHLWTSLGQPWRMACPRLVQILGWFLVNSGQPRRRSSRASLCDLPRQRRLPEMALYSKSTIAKRNTQRTPHKLTQKGKSLGIYSWELRSRKHISTSIRLVFGLSTLYSILVHLQGLLHLCTPESTIAVFWDHRPITVHSFVCSQRLENLL